MRWKESRPRNWKLEEVPVHDIQDKLEKHDLQARRLLYAELKKAKHERNESRLIDQY
jgi:hypothetical protein